MAPTPSHGPDGFDGVTFAVLGDPAGDHVVEAPDTQQEMLELSREARAKGLAFYCSTGAGGCGEPIIVVAGAVRRPHFRHHPGTVCTVSDYTAFADRCTHRLIQNELVRWLQSQGFRSKAEQYLDRRSRVDVFCEPGAVIEVQLSGETVTSFEDRTARYGGNVTWLFGQRSAITSRETLLGTDGAVQLVRLRPEAVNPLGKGRRIDIGLLATDAAETNWFPLRDCAFDPADGLQCPEFLSAKQRIARQREEKAKAAAERLRQEALLEARNRVRAIERREAAARQADARKLRAKLDVRQPVVPLLPWGSAPGPHPVVLGARSVTDWELKHHPLFIHRRGAWYEAAFRYPDEFARWASHIDGSWTAGLPAHLVDAAWAALFRAAHRISGPTEYLVDLSVDPNGIIIVHLARQQLITIASDDGEHWWYRLCSRGEAGHSGDDWSSPRPTGGQR